MAFTYPINVGWSVVSCQLSVVSGQLSVVSCQWSVVSGQLSVVSSYSPLHPCTPAPLHPCTPAPLHPCTPAPLLPHALPIFSFLCLAPLESHVYRTQQGHRVLSPLLS